jgi:hypothetical protein
MYTTEELCCAVKLWHGTVFPRVAEVDDFVAEQFGADVAIAAAMEARWKHIDHTPLLALTGAQQLRPVTRVDGAPRRWPPYTMILVNELGQVHVFRMRAAYRTLIARAKQRANAAFPPIV